MQSSDSDNTDTQIFSGETGSNEQAISINTVEKNNYNSMQAIKFIRHKSAHNAEQAKPIKFTLKVLI